MTNKPSDVPPITEADIAQFLVNTPDFFERHAELLSTVQLSSGHGSRAVSLQERQAEMLREKIKTLERRIMEMVRNGNDNMMITDKLQRWTRNLLHDVLEFLNAPEFLLFARRLTGEPTIDRVSAQATRYRPGQFLTRHQDEDVSEGRVCAYVINLSRNWDSDWGGLLQFHDADKRLLDSFVPYWNHLSLFRVPQSHTVSLVSPWAGSDRLAITGWFLAK